MREITSDRMLKEENYIAQLICFGIFMLAGVAVAIYPIVGRLPLVAVIVIEAGLGIPFGYFLGLRKIIKICKIIKYIKHGEYTVQIDELTSKRMVSGGLHSDTDDSYCQFTFKDYSKRAGKNICVKRTEYDKAKRGDKYYLVYLPIQKEPIRIYPQKEYYYK